MGARVLLVGSGAREHTIAWKLTQSPLVDAIFIAPGNAGTAMCGTNLKIQPKDIDGLVQAAKEQQIDFYLASMDDPQPLGLVDRLAAEGILCYGPTQAAARIEASKAWAKAFMDRAGIPTAKWAEFSDHAAAVEYIKQRGDKPCWVKASGLAAGKGAIGCNDMAEALEALDIAMVRRDFGSAGDTVVIEEPLIGIEASAQAFCDGKTAVFMPFSTDYKRAHDNDRGLNTGGMGAYCPSANASADVMEGARDVVHRVMTTMTAEGHPYAGTLYPGLMVGPDGQPSVIEFNARFGDPETQVVIPRLENDLFEVCKAAAEGRLDEIDVRWSDDCLVGVVLASGGYPATYKIGYVIEGLDAVDPDVQVFHHGTANDARGIVTNGGRIVTVVARGKTVSEARAKAYDNARRISFVDMQYRTDIAAGIE